MVLPRFRGRQVVQEVGREVAFLVHKGGARGAPRQGKKRCKIRQSPNMASLAISREDLRPVLDGHRGNQTLQRAFEAACAEPKMMLNVLWRYIKFNGALGPGVARLSGELVQR